MEKETKKKTKEESIKIIDNLIDDEKARMDKFSNAIKDLDDSVCPHVLEDLGYMHNDCVQAIARLERMKDSILNQGLGNEYAEAAFGIRY